MVLQVEKYDGVQPGVVICESLWPNCAFGDSLGKDDSSDEDVSLGINTLTSAEPGKPNGGAVFHDTAVWVRKIRAQIEN